MFLEQNWDDAAKTKLVNEFINWQSPWLLLLDFLKDAQEEGETAAALAFGHARDAEGYHAKLYERAIMNVIKDTVKEYHVCQVCGYVTDKRIPKKCPVCGAPKEKFKTIDRRS